MLPGLAGLLIAAFMAIMSVIDKIGEQQQSWYDMAMISVIDKIGE